MEIMKLPCLNILHHGVKRGAVKTRAGETVVGVRQYKTKKYIVNFL
jgi:hypothetical protein